MALSLTGINGSVALNGQTVTVKTIEDGGPARATAVRVGSVKGAAVWTGRIGGQFSLHYGSADGGADRFLSVRFKATDKEWWDAMAAAVMDVVRGTERAKKATT